MTTAARDRLARELRGGGTSEFSVELAASAGDLSVHVEGFGPVKFPVTPARARKLLVRAEWDDAALRGILATVKEELGLPNAAELTADLHSLLVYEPNQFFLAHQDSEKDDSMIGTLVVTLPSSYTGGELMVGLGEEWQAYRGSRSALSLVAF